MIPTNCRVLEALGGMAGLASLDRLFPLDHPGILSYETHRERSVAGIAEATGRSPGEVIIDTLVASDLRALFMLRISDIPVATGHCTRWR